jgi:hypothetical protein
VSDDDRPARDLLLGRARAHLAALYVDRPDLRPEQVVVGAISSVFDSARRVPRIKSEVDGAAEEIAELAREAKEITFRTLEHQAALNAMHEAAQMPPGAAQSLGGPVHVATWLIEGPDRLRDTLLTLMRRGRDAVRETMQPSVDAALDDTARQGVNDLDAWLRDQ